MKKYYDRVYYFDFRNHAIKFFYNADKYFPNIDLKYMFNLYFSSEARYQAELGSAIYLNIASADLYREMMKQGILNSNDYPKSDKTIENYYGDAMMWIVMQWSDLAFRYKLFSKDLIKCLGFNEMIDAYSVGHERDFASESEILFNRYVKDKINLQ